MPQLLQLIDFYNHTTLSITAIRDEGVGNSWIRNLASVNLNPANYNGRFETQKLQWWGTYQMDKADPVIFKDNVAAGSIIPYFLQGKLWIIEQCDNLTAILTSLQSK